LPRAAWVLVPHATRRHGDCTAMIDTIGASLMLKEIRR